MSDVAINIEQQSDGSILLDLETHRRAKGAGKANRFDANLAELLSEQALSEIATEVLEGVDADERSRSEWVKNYTAGLQLLGLMLEDSTPSDGKTISRVRHPLLLWSIVKFQSLTQGEMLPSNGPVKIRNDGDLSDEIAADLERAFNYYLTVTASEYYPDTDRALFYLGYGGTIFKKIYKCPIRRRPVSEFVALPDLIVSQDATDLSNALRVTHRIEMPHQTVLRYQKMKYWMDVELPPPTDVPTSVDEAESKHVTGVSAARERQQDWQHTIDETYTSLDLEQYGLGEKAQDEGIQLPYRVTIDRDSRTILEIKRNWRKDDPTWQPRKRFVKFGLIPGIGFLALGYLHLLGNHTKALTALERIIIDSGMFANFPSGVRVKGLRMDSNTIQPGPGEFPELDTAGLPINQAIMALPFKGPDATMLSLLQGLEAQGEKTAGQVEIKTGEGITDVPVGTVMAMIEQSAQVMTAVHRRLHQSQGEEFTLLRELLIEDPQLLQIPGAKPKWTPEQLASASLTPASNPNVPAHIHRIMQAVVLETLSTNHPDLYNIREVQRRILEIARISNADQVLIPIEALGKGQPAQDPTIVLGMMQQKIAEMQLTLRAKSDETNAALKAADLATKKETAKVQGMKTLADIQQGSQRLDQERQAHLEQLAESAADRVSREQVGMKQAVDVSDQAAADRESEYNLANLNAITQHTTAMASEDTARRAQDKQVQTTAMTTQQAAQTADRNRAQTAVTAHRAQDQTAATAQQGQAAQAEAAKAKAKPPVKPNG